MPFLHLINPSIFTTFCPETCNIVIINRVLIPLSLYINLLIYEYLLVIKKFYLQMSQANNISADIIKSCYNIIYYNDNYYNNLIFFETDFHIILLL